MTHSPGGTQQVWLRPHGRPRGAYSSRTTVGLQASGWAQQRQGRAGSVRPALSESLGHLHPQTSLDRAEGGAQRQGGLVLGSEKVVGALRTVLPREQCRVQPSLDLEAQKCKDPKCGSLTPQEYPCLWAEPVALARALQPEATLSPQDQQGPGCGDARLGWL